MNKFIRCALFEILFILINGQCSTNGLGKVISRFDCFSYSNGTYLCCYKNTTENGNGTCQEVQIADTLSIGENVDCGVEDTTYKEYEFTPYRPKQVSLDINLQSCGRTGPTKKKHCTDYSTIMNSCCFFQSGDSKGCYYLGKKYGGNSDLHKFKEVNEKDYSYECKSTNINKSIFLSFFTIILSLL